MLFCKPQMEASTEMKRADSLILDVQSPELGDNKCLLVTSPSLYYFVSLENEFKGLLCVRHIARPWGYKKE